MLERSSLAAPRCKCAGFFKHCFFVCGEALLWLQQVQEQVPFTPRTSAWPLSSF
uniref:Uncharacterized protein n=1 Tax=Anguilla anguilla TaxID=7936 RepID=A0A0E9S1B7_ANGAN